MISSSMLFLMLYGFLIFLLVFGILIVYNFQLRKRLKQSEEMIHNYNNIKLYAEKIMYKQKQYIFSLESQIRMTKFNTSNTKPDNDDAVILMENKTVQ